jgi:isoleucyl-tRNA synthetase
MGPGSAPRVQQQPDYPALELDVLRYWDEDGTFPASVEARTGDEFVFYDGPPFANGLPHYGHLLTGFVKDAVPRYQTMRGRRVERRFGWDCHGLPAEMEAERELDVSGRAGIEYYGVDRFNEYCRALVQRTTDQWESYVTRQARWVDFRDSYRTMDLPYMETVMWAFKRLWEKGLAYEGYRVLPYCWECETPLSNFETRQDDAYRPRRDPAVTVAFELDADPSGEGDPAHRPLKALVWTTTPWTLPSNLALAVGGDIAYSVLESRGELYLVGSSRAEAYEGLLQEPSLVATVKGSELEGRTYRPLFGFFSGTEGAFRVLVGDFVTTEEGTGIVHVAPGFGEDDQRLCDANGIATVCPVDEAGRFTAEVPDYEGLQVFAANEPIVRDLRSSGSLLLEETYEHNYPHCWRTDTPLIYKAVSSWFVQVTRIKDRLVELNRRINWVPEHVRDGAFGKWLEGARDWSISRNRFWGAPIPVWKSDDPEHPRVDVYGSLDELERDFGVRPADLHRPEIDRLTRPNPDDPSGKSTMRRVEDVMDCWFESGSMPFAQLHYPFENAERFESHFPADFIVEYVSQTRGWFYTLHVLSTALFDCPPFRTCIAHGIVLGHDGRKLSKRLGNYPDPDEVFATYGADAMRWFFLSSPVLRGQELVVDRRGVAEVVRGVLNPVWNAWYFLSLYSASDKVRGRRRTDAEGLLDRYILAKTASLVEEVTRRMDSYDLSGACAAVTTFLDALNNWYIRRSRDRFWRPVGERGPDADKLDAYDTLTTVLEALCRVAAPLLPLLTEAIYRQLTGNRSVHLTDWPRSDELPSDPELVSSMDRVREVCSAAHSVRKANGLRARLPLASLTVASPDAHRLEPFRQLIAEELNVRSVRLTEAVEELAELRLSLEPSRIGPRLGARTQGVLAAAREGRWRTVRGDGVVVGDEALEEDEYRLELRPRDESSGRSLGAGVVVLDLAVTPELAAEGLARDVVRVVQVARRDSGLDVADRIELELWAPADVADAVQANRPYLMEQTLSEAVSVTPLPRSSPAPAAPDGARRYQLPDDSEVYVAVARVGALENRR